MLALRQHLSTIRAHDWAAWLALFVTLLVACLTSEPKDAILTAPVWKAMFVLGAVGSLGKTVWSAWRTWRGKSADQICDDLLRELRAKSSESVLKGPEVPKLPNLGGP